MNNLTPWTMIEGRVTEYKDIVTGDYYILKNNGFKPVNLNKQIRGEKRGNINMVESYIIDKGLSIFSLNKFLEDNPKNNITRVKEYVNDLITRKYLSQLDGNGNFKVNFIEEVKK